MSKKKKNNVKRSMKEDEDAADGDIKRQEVGSKASRLPQTAEERSGDGFTVATTPVHPQARFGKENAWTWPGAVMTMVVTFIVVFGIAFLPEFNKFATETLTGFGTGIKEILFGIGGGFSDFFGGCYLLLIAIGLALQEGVATLYPFSTIKDISRCLAFSVLLSYMPTVGVMLQSMVTKWVPSFYGILPSNAARN